MKLLEALTSYRGDFLFAGKDRLTLIVERWLHDELDADHRVMPRATMRWQWCQRPHHPDDDDCACCLTNPPYDFECGCICHRRVNSLVLRLWEELTNDLDIDVVQDSTAKAE
jgi:hypothetical protein